jgi:hypothetical protein
MASSPPRPSITSGPGVPKRVSGPSVPTMVGVRPSQVPGGVVVDVVVDAGGTTTVVDVVAGTVDEVVLVEGRVVEVDDEVEVVAGVLVDVEVLVEGCVVEVDVDVVVEGRVVEVLVEVDVDVLVEVEVEVDVDVLVEVEVEVDVVVVGRVVEVDDEVDVVELVGVLLELLVEVPGTVRMSTHHPPLKSVAPWFWSSVTQRLQVPLGLPPFRLASATVLEGVGAGGSKASSAAGFCEPTSSLSFTGRQVPLTILVSAGSWLVAWSSKLRSTFTSGPVETLLSPPASDIRMVFEPLGAETITSWSSTQCCGGVLLSPVVVSPRSVTFTSLTTPVRPETMIVDG